MDVSISRPLLEVLAALNMIVMPMNLEFIKCQLKPTIKDFFQLRGHLEIDVVQWSMRSSVISMTLPLCQPLFIFILPTSIHVKESLFIFKMSLVISPP